MNEQQYGKGAIKIHPVRRYIHRKLKREKVGGAPVPFDWQNGFDVRNVIGPITIKNQGMSESCGGQAGSYFLEIQRRLQKINEGSLSAKSVYAPLHANGGGMTVSAVEQQIGAYGAFLEAIIPSYDTNGNPLTEQSYEDKSWFTSSAQENMSIRAGYTPMDVPLDMDSIANAIKQYGAVIWEIEIQNGHTPSWLSSTPQPPSKTNPNPIDNHFMCGIAAGLVNGVQILTFLNSWGETVGLNGTQMFHNDYVQQGVVDCFTFVKDTQIQPVAGNNSVWAFIWSFFTGKPLPV